MWNTKQVASPGDLYGMMLSTSQSQHLLGGSLWSIGSLSTMKSQWNETENIEVECFVSFGTAFLFAFL